MKVLNAYAGIGGNRHLWPDEWKITAVELDARVAAEYGRRYPNDIVLVEDAHAFVMKRSAEFNAVWTSPPCPTHSRLARTAAGLYKTPMEPDPRLWAEIAHLKTLEIAHVIENVHVYYSPPIPPDVITARHWYWVSDAPLLLTNSVSASIVNASATEFARVYGLPPVPIGAVKDSRKAMRNAVVPLEGLEIATAAFAAALTIAAA